MAAWQRYLQSSRLLPATGCLYLSRYLPPLVSRSRSTPIFRPLRYHCFPWRHLQWLSAVSKTTGLSARLFSPLRQRSQCWQPCIFISIKSWNLLAYSRYSLQPCGAGESVKGFRCKHDVTIFRLRINRLESAASLALLATTAVLVLTKVAL